MDYLSVLRRIGLTWAAFGKLCNILTNKCVPINLKRRVYDASVLSVSTYGLETMSLTKQNSTRLQTTERDYGKSHAGFFLRDRIQNNELQKRTKVEDISGGVEMVMGRIFRKEDDSWANRILNCSLQETKRSGLSQKR